MRRRDLRNNGERRLMRICTVMCIGVALQVGCVGKRSLIVKIDAAKVTFCEAEPLVVQAHLVNDSNSPVAIYENAIGRSGIVREQLNEDEVGRTGSVMRWRLEGTTKEAIGSPATLLPGGEARRDVDVSSMLQHVLNEGRYQITISYSSYYPGRYDGVVKWIGDVESNQLLIDVKKCNR